MGPEGRPTLPGTCTGPGPGSPEPLATLAQGPEDGALDLAAGRGVHEPQGHLAHLDQVVGVDAAWGAGARRAGSRSRAGSGFEVGTSAWACSSRAVSRSYALSGSTGSR